MGPDPRPKRVRLRRPLPTAAYDSRRTGTERVAMTRNGQRLLMLIDDEPAQRRLVSALAARGGWRSVFAADAEMAIAMLGTQDGMQLDAIVLDIWSDRKSVVEGKSVSVRVDFGWRRTIKKK